MVRWKADIIRVISGIREIDGINATTVSISIHGSHRRNDLGLITREKIDNVLASEGYLLFYSKMFIDYE